MTSPRLLRALGLAPPAPTLDDLVALAHQEALGPDRSSSSTSPTSKRRTAPRRSLERRISRSSPRPLQADGRLRLELADARSTATLVESRPRLDFLAERAQRRARRAAGPRQNHDRARTSRTRPSSPGTRVLFITAAQLLLDLGAQESARALDRRLQHYAKVGLLVHRRGRLPRLRQPQRRPALPGRQPPVREEEPRAHHQPRLRRLAHHLPQRRRAPPRSSTASSTTPTSSLSRARATAVATPRTSGGRAAATLHPPRPRPPPPDPCATSRTLFPLPISRRPARARRRSFVDRGVAGHHRSRRRAPVAAITRSAIAA